MCAHAVTGDSGSFDRAGQSVSVIGEPGTHAVPAAASDLLLCDALIHHRTACVGSWQDASVVEPPQPRFEHAPNVERWEPWVRAAVLDSELYSHISFEPVASSGAVMALSHVEPGKPSQPIVTMSAPPVHIMRHQLGFLASYAELRADRASEILAQNGLPLLPLWGSIVALHAETHRYTVELLAAVGRWSTLLAMRFKHTLDVARPNVYSPQVQPMVQTPGHASLPAEHAAKAYCVAAVLECLVSPGNDALGRELHALAARVAVNRTVAGVHFPLDNTAGRLLGITFANYLIARLDGEPACRGRRFDGSTVHEEYAGTDFDPHESLDAVQLPTGIPTPFRVLEHVTTSTTAPVWSWLWARARAEWRPLADNAVER